MPWRSKDKVFSVDHHMELRVRRLWLHSLLVIAPVLVFVQVLTFPFVRYDDYGNIVDNPGLNPPSIAKVVEFWKAPYYSLYAPVTYTFWASEAQLGGRYDEQEKFQLSPRLFHLSNLLLHLVIVQLVFGLLLWLTDEPLGACCGALLFALHPLQVETVAWVTETKGLLAALFGTVAIWEYLRYAKPAAEKPQGSQEVPALSANVHYAIASVAFALALLSKPSALAVPLIALVFDRFWFQRAWSQVMRGIGPWLLGGLMLGLVTKAQQGDSMMAVVSPLWGRPLVAAQALVFYAYKLVFPLWLGPDYGLDPLRVIVSWRGVASLVVVLGVGVAWYLLRPDRRWVTAVGVSVAALAPVLGLVAFGFQETSTVADRYFYPAMLGPALAVALLAGQHWSRGFLLGASAVGLVLASGSFLQARTWRSSEALAEHGLWVNPRSVAMHNLQGMLLAEEAERAEEQLDALTAQEKRKQALEHRRVAASENPFSAKAHALLGIALAQQQDFEGAVAAFDKALDIAENYAEVHEFYGRVELARDNPDAALAHYEQALSLGRSGAGLYEQYGALLASRNRMSDAIEAYKDALAIDAKNAAAWTTLGHLQHATGDRRSALESCRRALEIDDKWVPAYNNLGAVLFELNQRDEALAQFRRALEISPDDPDANNSMGTILTAQGELDRAIVCFELVLRKRPDDASAHYNLAAVFGRQRRGREALTHYREALRNNPDFVAAHVGIATELDQQGNVSEALRHMSEAVKLAPNQFELQNALGVLQNKSGDRAAARASFERSLQLNPNFEPAKQNLAALDQLEESASEGATPDEPASPPEN